MEHVRLVVQVPFMLSSPFKVTLGLDRYSVKEHNRGWMLVLSSTFSELPFFTLDLILAGKFKKGKQLTIQNRMSYSYLGKRPLKSAWLYLYSKNNNSNYSSRDNHKTTKQ